ncbi:MAG: histidine kinase dimerization/phospho-acceptor domain-containing protein, partial [Desulfuromonadaceae bacterium]
MTPRFFPQETLIGTGCRALFHPDVSEEPCDCPVGRALHGESCQVAFSVTRHNGKIYYFDIRDVTDRRARELQLLQSEKMSSIGLLAAGVAHEINNPMTSVAGYAEALQRRFRDAPELTEDVRLTDFPRYLDVIVREVYRCKGIIDSLLSFSRKSEGDFGEVDLNAIICEVLELVRHQGRDKNVRLLEKLLAPLPRVNGDASALRQVFLNLVLNAVQAIEDTGTVTVET